MANTKKYVSLDKLELYDDKIKEVIANGDKAALDSAKLYADGLAKNYDAAGSAATAEANAKAYADGKDAAIQAAHKAGTDAAAAASVADGKAVAAQNDVDALETYVGTFTHDTAKSVVEYINAKTDGIATSGNLEALGTRVTAVEGDVATIKGDYLKAADKTELEGKITEANTAVATEKSRAEGIEAGLRTDVNAIMEDYLTSDDKNELAEAIADEAERAAGVEEGLAARIKAVEDDYLTSEDAEALQNQINLIMNNPDTDKVINSITEFTQYIEDHGEIADGFRADIDKNKEDIAANAKAIADHADAAAAAYATKTELANEKKALQDEIDADVKVVADDLVELEGVVNGLASSKADASALASAVETLEGVDAGFETRIAGLEAKFGDGDDNVAGMIATAKQEAIDAAASAAAAKDEVVLAAAKKYADDEDAKIEERVANLETASATHALASDLTALAGRVTTAEGEIDTLQTEMDAVEALAAANKAAHEANAAAIALKASQADLEAVSGRVSTLETWHNNFTEVSEEEINALFA